MAVTGVVAIAALAGCTHAEPREDSRTPLPAQIPFLEAVWSTSIRVWPAPAAAGESASAVGELTEDPLDGTLRWEPWPGPATPRERTELMAEAERLRATADTLNSDMAIVGARNKLAQVHWELYLLERREQSAASALTASLDLCIQTLASIVKDFPDATMSAQDPTLFRLATTMRALGDSERTRKVLQRLIRIPDQRYAAAGFTMFGSVLEQLGEHKGAAAFYINSLRIPPRRHGATAYTRYLLGQALSQAGMVKQSKRALEEAVADANAFPTQHSELVARAATAALTRLGEPTPQ